ncbi:MAG: carbohydrate-binding domain-containing protein [Lachnospiraceae bacterium]
MKFINRINKCCSVLFINLLLFALIVTGCSRGTENPGFTDDNSSGSGFSGSDSAEDGDGSGDIDSDADSSGASGDSSAGNVSLRTESDFADMFSDRDYEVGYDETQCAEISLKGDSASSSCDAVQISGNTVTITDEGTYVISGTLNDGMLIVNAGEKDKLHLIFDGVTIHSSTSAAIYILEADKVFITLKDNTSSTLSNGGTFTAIDDNNIDGCIFSKQDLTFNGSGSLSVTSPAGHGIVCKDDLVVTSGTYTIDSASHGLDANDSIRIANASFSMTSGKDGFHAENSDDASLGFVYIESGNFDISAEGDGLSAGSDMMIKDGSFTITAGGGSENAEKKSSDSWGDFKGGHRGGTPGHSSDDMPGSSSGDAPGGTDVPEDFPDEAPDGSSDQEPEFSSGIIDTGSAGNMEITGIVNAAQIMNAAAVTDITEITNAADTTDNSAGQDDSTSIKGIKAAGNLIISGGTFSIDSADDTIHSNASILVNGGTFQLSSGDDGFHADDTLSVTDGTITVLKSYEGMEGLHVDISGATIALTADDDGLNAAGGSDQSGFGGTRKNDRFGGGPGGSSSSSNGTITISGGTLNISASGDGIDANGSLAISGGNVTVCGPVTGDTSILDYDTSAVITGGTFIGTGATQMAQSFSDSEQGVIAVRTGIQAAGTTITVSDNSGSTIVTCTPALPFEMMIISSPELGKGETCTVIVGNTSSEVTAE